MTIPSSPTVVLATAPSRSGSARNQSDLIYVAGRVSYRSWEGKDGQKHRATEIVATELIPLDRKPNGDLHVVNGQDDAADLPF